MTENFDQTSDKLNSWGLDFAAPWWVVCAALLIGLVYTLWFWRRRSRRVAVPYDHASGNTGRRWRVAISIAESSLGMLAIILLMVLCGPLSTGTPIERRSVSNIQFCVDSSGSMTARFGDGNRYDASMAAINQFLDYREGDAFGLTFFATAVVHWCPLTTDSSAFRCAIPFMKPDQQRAIGGGTQIAKALENCRDVLKSREDGDRMIILVSDGFSSDLAGGRAEELAKKLRQDDITVYAIHIGGGEIPGDVLTITTNTDGDAFVPEDTEAFAAVFRHIDQMRPAKIEFVESEKVDNFAPWCIAALSLLGVWTITLFGLRYTPW